MKKMYIPSEIAKKLGVSVNTIKKRAIEAEAIGYRFKKNDGGHRQYTKEELEMLFPSKDINLHFFGESTKEKSENRMQMDENFNSLEIRKIIQTELEMINGKIKKSEQVIIEHKKNIEENKLRREGIENLLVSITRQIKNEEQDQMTLNE
ncbi:hypothetical protein [Bacillus nitratireducens]|uniref:hypothetical protein n=1 Tax=Bacillus nitratireducens TaxID=2026193 RepID=UPI002E760B8C|nr:hypothetical protein [Bacillus nitratireducens]